MNTPFVLLAIRIGEFKKYRYKRHIKINAKSKNIGKISKVQIYTHQILKRQIFLRNSIEFEGTSPFIFLSTRSTLLSAAKIQEIWNSNTGSHTHVQALLYTYPHTHTHTRVHNVDVLPILIRRWWLITRDDHRADRSVAFVLSDSGTTRSVTT